MKTFVVLGDVTLWTCWAANRFYKRIAREEQQKRAEADQQGSTFEGPRQVYFLLVDMANGPSKKSKSLVSGKLKVAKEYLLRRGIPDINILPDGGDYWGIDDGLLFLQGKQSKKDPLIWNGASSEKSPINLMVIAPYWSARRIKWRLEARIRDKFPNIWVASIDSCYPRRHLPALKEGKERFLALCVWIWSRIRVLMTECRCRLKARLKGED